MILTCPECATRYLANDDSIGENGRTVRCSKCQTTWYVAAEVDEFTLRDNQKKTLRAVDLMDIPDIPKEKSASAQTTPSLDRSSNPAKDDGFDTTRNTKQQRDEDRSKILPTRGAHVEIRDKADAERRRRRIRTVLLIWLIPLFLLSLAVAMAFLFRNDIVRKLPQTATIYKQLGVDVSLSGLSIEDPVIRTTLINNEAVLVVNGAVRNISSKPQDVPLIKFTLHDKSGTELTSWLVETTVRQLERDGRVTYISEYPNPPVDAVEVRYEFEGENAVSAPAAAPTPN